MLKKNLTELDKRDIEDVSVFCGISLGKNRPAFLLVGLRIMVTSGIVTYDKLLCSGFQGASGSLQCGRMVPGCSLILQFGLICSLMVEKVDSPYP